MQPDLITQDLFGNEIHFFPGNKPRNKDTAEVIAGFSAGTYTPMLVMQRSEPKFVIKCAWIGAYAANYEPDMMVHENLAAVVFYVAKPKAQASPEKFIEYAYKMGIVETNGIIL